jgi:hypothetical protein
MPPAGHRPRVPFRGSVAIAVPFFCSAFFFATNLVMTVRLLHEILVIVIDSMRCLLI